MWPWSTIRNLRMELAQAEQANAILRRQKDAGLTRESQLHRLNSDLKVLFNDVDGERLKLEDVRTALTETIDNQAREIKRLENENRFAKRERDQVMREADDLRAQLAVAVKNDQRDSRGRFTKAVDFESRMA